MKSKYSVKVLTGFVVIAAIFQLAWITGRESADQDVNKPPLVEITKPYNNTDYIWDTPVHYEIKVSDREDGESKFDELNVNEIFLEVEYAATAPPKENNFRIKKDAQGLSMIKTSNCFNCHTFNSKLIGPSFFDISKKYLPTKANIELVAKRTRAGSTGVWGKEKMPGHPELNEEQTKSIVQWILEKAADPKISYYSGTEGLIRFPLPAGESAQGVLILTASYTDHGVENDPTQRLKGQERIILLGKPAPEK
jgi:cytochrome c